MDSAARRERFWVFILTALVAALVASTSASAQGPRAEPQTQPFENTDAAVAFDGTNYFVLSDQIDPNTKKFGTFATRVRPDGTVLDPNGIEIIDGFRISPKIAFDGTNYLVVWAEFRSGESSNIFGA
jgi:hypothetical protein